MESLLNLKVPEALQNIYAHIKASNQINDVSSPDRDLLHIYSSKVLQMIVANEPGWEEMVPPEVAKLINDKCLFGHPCFIGKKNS